MTQSFSTISLFTGVGGLDYGFEAAGFETRVALEFNQQCCESLAASRRWPVLCRDLMGTSTKEILKASGLRANAVDMLIGGPPCQPFSKSGWWKSGESRRLDDPRAATLAGYLRVLREAKPKAFLLENVEGLAFEGKDEGLRLLLAEVEAINASCRTKYRPAVVTLNAADFGVPQTRTRVFVIASRDGREFVPPTPTHAEVPDEAGVHPWITAWDAIGGLKAPVSDELRLTGKWADLLPIVPEGQNYLWHTDRLGGVPLFGWRRRYWNFLLKLAKNRPAWTIQAQPGPATGPFHWSNRRLSVDELARLQTLPRDISVVGSLADAQRQIGNAVPSLLAEVLAREIRRQFFDSPALAARPTLAVRRRAAIPSPEQVATVPKKYLELAGIHVAHPGTGRGYAYEAAPGAALAS